MTFVGNAQSSFEEVVLASRGRLKSVFIKNSTKCIFLFKFSNIFYFFIKIIAVLSDLRIIGGYQR